MADGAIAASEVSGLATVATSGSYADLSGKPTIPASPGLELIAVHTFSGSLTYNVENFSSTYDDYLLIVQLSPASNGAASMRFKVGGSYLTSSTYRMHVSKLSSASASYSAWNTSSLPYITLSGANTVSSASTAKNSFMIHATNVNDAARYPSAMWKGSFSDATNFFRTDGACDIPTAGALQGIQFLVGDGSSVNVGGTAKVYGYKKTA